MANYVILAILGFTAALGVVKADQTDLSKAIRIEGHGFSASTLKPLPGVEVQLFAFHPGGMQFIASATVVTDEGGFYSFEELPLHRDENGSDIAVGYAFALVCMHANGVKVQIMPLYRSLQPSTVYARNFYMQVPESVVVCGL